MSLNLCYSLSSLFGIQIFIHNYILDKTINDQVRFDRNNIESSERDAGINPEF